MPEGTTHQPALDFVMDVKKYLESTTKFNIMWNVYENEPHTTERMLNGDKYAYDLVGTYIGSPNELVLIEAKKRSQLGNLARLFDEFLVKSFSVFLKHRKDHSKWVAYFMFITDHAFHCSRYKEIYTCDYLKEKINKSIENNDSKGITNQYTIADLKDFSNKLWIIIFSNKQNLLCIDPKKLLLFRVTSREGFI